MELKGKNLNYKSLTGQAVVSISETDSVESELEAIHKACGEMSISLPDELNYLRADYDGEEFAVKRIVSEDGNRIAEISFGFELKTNDKE